MINIKGVRTASRLTEGYFMDKMLDDSQANQAETIVGPSVKIQGDLNSEGNIRIEGQVMGKVKTSQSVYINSGAKITADVNAGNVVVGGEVQGNLKVSGQLVLQSTAKIAGDITCKVLRVEDGALFTGKCSMNVGQVGAAVPAVAGKKGNAKEALEIEEE